MIVSPVSTVGALHVTLNTPRCGSGVTLTTLGAGGSVCKQIHIIYYMKRQLVSNTNSTLNNMYETLHYKIPYICCMYNIMTRNSIHIKILHECAHLGSLTLVCRPTHITAVHTSPQLCDCCYSYSISST